MSADSKAVFQARVQALGLQDFLAALAGKGWATLGEFAFSFNFYPGPSEADTFDEAVVEQSVGARRTRQSSCLALPFL